MKDLSLTIQKLWPVQKVLRTNKQKNGQVKNYYGHDLLMRGHKNVFNVYEALKAFRFEMRTNPVNPTMNWLYGFQQYISYIAEARAHIHASWSSFNQYSTQYSFQATGYFPT